MNEKDIRQGLRVVTNNGRWGTVIGRTCCYHHADGNSEHGDHVSCNYWDGWWQVLEDGHGQVMQNAERMRLTAVRMFDGTYLPDQDDPHPEIKR